MLKKEIRSVPYVNKKYLAEHTIKTIIPKPIIDTKKTLSLSYVLKNYFMFL